MNFNVQLLDGKLATRGNDVKDFNVGDRVSVLGEVEGIVVKRLLRRNRVEVQLAAAGPGQLVMEFEPASLRRLGS